MKKHEEEPSEQSPAALGRAVLEAAVAADLGALKSREAPTALRGLGRMVRDEARTRYAAELEKEEARIARASARIVEVAEQEQSGEVDPGWIPSGMHAVVGVLRDRSTGAALAGHVVRLAGGDVVASTDDLGRFVIASSKAVGDIEVVDSAGVTLATAELTTTKEDDSGVRRVELEVEAPAVVAEKAARTVKARGRAAADAAARAKAKTSRRTVKARPRR